MKTWIYKSKFGSWYILGKNYKDKNDNAYCNLFFPKNSEPQTELTSCYVNILEAKGTSYKNKFGMTIFKYNMEKEPEKDEESIWHDGEIDTSKFGNKTPEPIKPDDLPFY